MPSLWGNHSAMPSSLAAPIEGSGVCFQATTESMNSIVDSEAKFIRDPHRHIVISTVNVTAWGSLKACLVRGTLHADIVLVQEHRLVGFSTKSSKQTVAEAEKVCRSRGYECSFEPATLTNTGHTSAGVAILWKPWVAAVGVGVIHKSRAMFLDVRYNRGILRTVSFYGLAEGSDSEKYDLVSTVVGNPQVGSIEKVLIGADS